MEEFVCVTVLSQPNESEADFSARLSRFWTYMLRNLKDDFEKVYAETTAFEPADHRLSRKYLMQEEVIDLLARELRVAEVEFEPIDLEDTYSKYEAVPPEWMQIEH